MRTVSGRDGGKVVIRVGSGVNTGPFFTSVTTEGKTWKHMDRVFWRVVSSPLNHCAKVRSSSTTIMISLFDRF